MSALSPLDAAAAASRVASGKAVLIDVREDAELARERIAGALHAPLSRLEQTPIRLPDGAQPVFFCRSGMRTATNAGRLAAKVKGPAFVLTGGLGAWKSAGLPVEGKGGGGAIRIAILLGLAALGLWLLQNFGAGAP